MCGGLVGQAIGGDRKSKRKPSQPKDGNKAAAADRKAIYSPSADKMISGPPAAK
jgi:hypothetical protein